MRFTLTHLALLFMSANVALTAEPIVIADFEGNDYGAWQVDGTAFGNGPARGTLPGQMHVDGFQGSGLVNSFNHGDDSIGSLTSPPFVIQRQYIRFLIGGGNEIEKLAIQLIIDDKIVRKATGPNDKPGGRETLGQDAWDVSEFKGKSALIRIIDQAQGGWGHINLDEIMQSDQRPDVLLTDVTREFKVTNRYLNLPIQNGASKRKVTLMVDGRVEVINEIELAETQTDWWAHVDAKDWLDRTVSIKVDKLFENSSTLESIDQTDAVKGSDLYREPLRSQLHFSSKRGWLNDPNGLVFYQGRYHLFYQHNPYGWGWGNMHWGHATSTDLVHWEEHGDVLCPDEQGAMFSGSAVVDWNNTSGFGKENLPPLVLIYTAAGNPTTQCIAYSTDGMQFTKYEGNPVIQEISGGNRDPKVFWHEPTKKWVMVLYVEMPGKKHTVHFFNSPNLRDWTLTSITDGGVDGDKYLFECPDFFELPLARVSVGDGVGKDATGKDVASKDDERKWVLTAANSEYAIGSFDGLVFKPEASRLADVRGRGFYAAQTFSDTPDGRRIQIGWCQAPSPGMAFNQLQSIPSVLTLRSTAEGARLHRTPVKELELLRDGPNQADSLTDFRGELIELRAEFEPDESAMVEFHLRGAKIVYDTQKQELIVNDHRVPAPLCDQKQSITIFVDRTMLEVFASNGLTYVPLPFIPKQEDQSVTLQTNGNVKMETLEVFRLKSIWRPAGKD